MGQTATKAVRDVQVAQDNLGGMVYREIAKKHGINKSTVCRILQKPEIKDVIDTGFNEMVHRVPKAIHVQDKSLKATDESGSPTALAMKASENILKMTAILPSNVQNQTINNIYNQQNNIVTPETMELVKAIMPGFQEPTTLED